MANSQDRVPGALFRAWLASFENRPSETSGIDPYHAALGLPLTDEESPAEFSWNPQFVDWADACIRPSRQRPASWNPRAHALFDWVNVWRRRRLAAEEDTDEDDTVFPNAETHLYSIEDDTVSQDAYIPKFSCGRGLNLYSWNYDEGSDVSVAGKHAIGMLKMESNLPLCLSEAGFTAEVYRDGLAELERGKWGNPFRAISFGRWGHGPHSGGRRRSLGEANPILFLGSLWLAAAFPELRRLSVNYPAGTEDSSRMSWGDLWHRANMMLGAYVSDVHAARYAVERERERRRDAHFLAAQVRHSKPYDDESRALESALMKFAARPIQVDEPQYPAALDPTGITPLTDYVLRALREQVARLWPARKHKGYGLNKITAELASIVLAEKITANKVAKAIQGTALARPRRQYGYYR